MYANVPPKSGNGELPLLDRLNLTPPYTLSNVNYPLFQVEVSNSQGANLATPDSSLGQN
jgi:hypothetical protein